MAYVRSMSGVLSFSRPRKRRKAPVLAYLLLISVILSSCSGESPSDKARIRASLPEVRVETLAQHSVPLAAELPARVSAFRKAEVRPQVGGILMEQLFTEGSLVRQGQSLYKINADMYEAAVESAKAEVARARARLHAAHLAYTRRRSLLNANAVSKQGFEDAEAEYLQARADCDVADASLRTARIQLRYTDVLAPITGRIGKSAMTQGALVTANQPEPLAVIQQLDPVYVDMTRSSLELLHVRERYASGSLRRPDAGKTRVRLLLDNQKPYPLEGSLRFSDSTVDESTGMVLLRAIVSNPDGTLLPGMYVRAIVDEGMEDNALVVPQLAVRRNAKGEASVFVLGDNDTVEERPVTLAERVGSGWLVRQGLKEGEKVVVEGQHRLRHGLKVRIR